MAATKPATTVAAKPPAGENSAAAKHQRAMAKRQAAPWWVTFVPDMRGFAAAGFFGMAMYLLYMIGQRPQLLDSAPFMQFAGMIMTGGVLLVGNFLFGGTKSGSDTNAQMVDALRDSAPPKP